MLPNYLTNFFPVGLQYPCFWLIIWAELVIYSTYFCIISLQLPIYCLCQQRRTNPPNNQPMTDILDVFFHIHSAFTKKMTFEIPINGNKPTQILMVNQHLWQTYWILMVGYYQMDPWSHHFWKVVSPPMPRWIDHRTPIAEPRQTCPMPGFQVWRWTMTNLVKTAVHSQVGSCWLVTTCPMNISESTNHPPNMGIKMSKTTHAWGLQTTGSTVHGGWSQEAVQWYWKIVVETEKSTCWYRWSTNRLT